VQCITPYKLLTRKNEPNHVLETFLTNLYRQYAMSYILYGKTCSYTYYVDLQHRAVNSTKNSVGVFGQTKPVYMYIKKPIKNVLLNWKKNSLHFPLFFQSIKIYEYVSTNANQPVETHIWCKRFLWWRRIIMFQWSLLSVCSIVYTAVFGSKLRYLSTRQHQFCFNCSVSAH